MVDSIEQALADGAIAAERGAQMIEWRIDRIAADQSDAAESIVNQSPLPCIVTCRAAWEGGEFEGDEPTRLAALERAGLNQPAYLDIELAAYQRSANLRQKVHLVVDHDKQVRSTSTGLILSSHDFQRRPSDLIRRVAAMAEAPACRVIKLAWRARSLRDNLEAFELLRAAHKPTIALCMGPFGLASRVLAGKFGALLTFAGLDDDSVTAPGQVGLETIKRLYRWDSLGPRTQVFGVIGWPVEHSMSPAIHNAGFDETGFDGVYLPMPIPDQWESFKATLGAWLDYKPLDFRGASVTIPHKHHLLRFGEENSARINPLARQIGAANTLWVDDCGQLHIDNTDYAAALDPVCQALGRGRDEIADLEVAVIGAGGAARAVVAGYAHHGASVTVYNRTLERAEQLATSLASDEQRGSITAAPLEALAGAHATVFINCTPIGMHPKTQATPLPELPRAINSDAIVFDTIYNPIETRLLADARAAGAKVISGLEMFVRQGAAQFERWTGQSAPVERFAEVLREQLASL